MRNRKNSVIISYFADICEKTRHSSNLSNELIFHGFKWNGWQKTKLFILFFILRNRFVWNLVYVCRFQIIYVALRVGIAYIYTKQIVPRYLGIPTHHLKFSLSSVSHIERRMLFGPTFLVCKNVISVLTTYVYFLHNRLIARRTTHTRNACVEPWTIFICLRLTLYLSRYLQLPCASELCQFLVIAKVPKASTYIFCWPLSVEDTDPSSSFDLDSILIGNL